MFDLSFAIFFRKLFQQFPHHNDFLLHMSVSNFFNHKKFFRPNWSVTYFKDDFII